MIACDKDIVKAAAVGRWREVARGLGIGEEYLTGNHGPCPKCGGTDRWRIYDDFDETGGAICNKCGQTIGDGLALVQWWSGCDFQAAVERTGIAMGVVAGGEGGEWTPPPPADPILALARVKGIPSVASIIAYGAQAMEDGSVVLPVYGPDGKQCNTFTVKVNGNDKERKGKFGKGRPAGLFLPRDEGGVRLPRHGEEWMVVEGFKDAAVLHSLDYVAVGMNTSFMDAKYASLFAGVNVTLIPDRDSAGVAGAKKTTASLFGQATSIKLAILPVAFTATHGKDVRDVLKMKDGESLLRQAIAAARPSQHTEMPRVFVGMREGEVSTEVVDAIGELGWNDGEDESLRTYQRGGGLVHVTTTEDHMLGGVDLPTEMLRIRPLPPSLIRERITTAVQLWGWNKQKQAVNMRPPMWLVGAVRDRGQYPSSIRRLTSIIRCPTLRPDGTVLQAAGYDERTRLLYVPDGNYPPVPDNPTREDAEAAARRLLDVVVDFPFKSDDHRSVWLAMLLTMVGRPAVPGVCPMFVVDANTRGSGKSKLTDAAAIIAYGNELPRKPWPGRDDDEVRKTITAIALEGLPAVLWDNVSGELGCPSLDAALTGTTWKERVLGVSQLTETLPLHTIWVATGNNVTPVDDTPRRILYCRIESPLECPEERTGFQREDLLGWVRDNRHQLAVDAVTILRAYAAAGRPKMNIPTWGSYEAFSGLIRSAIVWAGLPDPWATRDIVREMDNSAELLGLIHAGIEEADADGRGVTCSEIVQLLGKPVDRPENDRYPRLREAVTQMCGAKINGRTIGNVLKQFHGRVHGGMVLNKKPGKAGNMRWSVGPFWGEGRGGSGGSGGSIYPPLQNKLRGGNDIQGPGVQTTNPTNPTHPPDVEACPDCGDPLVEKLTFDGYRNLECARCDRVWSSERRGA